MRFEVFDGPRSIATVSLRTDGRVLVRARDAEARDRILPHFAGAGSDRDGLDVVVEETFDAFRFEEACRELGEEEDLSVAPRPSDVPE